MVGDRNIEKVVEKEEEGVVEIEDEVAETIEEVEETIEEVVWIDTETIVLETTEIVETIGTDEMTEEIVRTGIEEMIDENHAEMIAKEEMIAEIDLEKKEYTVEADLAPLQEKTDSLQLNEER